MKFSIWAVTQVDNGRSCHICMFAEFDTLLKCLGPACCLVLYDCIDLIYLSEM